MHTLSWFVTRYFAIPAYRTYDWFTTPNWITIQQTSSMRPGSTLSRTRFKPYRQRWLNDSNVWITNIVFIFEMRQHDNPEQRSKNLITSLIRSTYTIFTFLSHLFRNFRNMTGEKNVRQFRRQKNFHYEQCANRLFSISIQYVRDRRNVWEILQYFIV